MNKHWDQPMPQADASALTEHESGTASAAATRAAVDELQFRELFRMLRRRSRFILITALCGALIVLGLGVLIPPKYTAKAQLVIDQGTTEAAALSKDETVVESHATMLRSRDHLQRVMESLRDDPAVDPALRADKQSNLNRGAVQTSPGNISSGWRPASSDFTTRLKIWVGRFVGDGDRTRLILDQLERRLAIAHDVRSRIIGVSFTWTDPYSAAIVANRVVNLYIEIGREQKLAGDKAEIARLDSRIAELKVEMEQSTGAVQAMVRQKPDVTKPIDEVGEANQHMQRLERDAAAKAQLYRTLVQRQQQLLDRQETIEPDAHVLSLAPPPDRPSSTNPLLFIPPAFIFFLICGSLLAVLLERLDRGLRTEREIDDALGIPCIGLVPLVEEVDRNRPLHQYLLAEPFTAYAEALRSIAATMQLASSWPQPKVLMVTSSLPGEGKSALAVSLSVCIALLRRRVLLIDLDSRHASTLCELDGDTERGVTDLLLSGASRELSASKLVKPVPELGIDYLPMNRFSIYPFMRFADVEMPSFIRKLRDSYDCVILNSPPVLGRTETRLLATLADEIFFAVKWGSTRREFAQSALRLLRNNEAMPPAPRPQSVSAIITQVDLKKHAHYGYGDIGEYFSNLEKESLRSLTTTITATTLRTSPAGFLRKFLNRLATGRSKAASPSLQLRTRITHWAAGLSKAGPGGPTS